MTLSLYSTHSDLVQNDHVHLSLSLMVQSLTVPTPLSEKLPTVDQSDPVSMVIEYDTHTMSCAFFLYPETKCDYFIYVCLPLNHFTQQNTMYIHVQINLVYVVQLYCIMYLYTITSLSNHLFSVIWVISPIMAIVNSAKMNIRELRPFLYCFGSPRVFSQEQYF